MRTHRPLLLLLCLVVAFQLNAQTFHIRNGCHYDGDDTEREVYTYPPSQEAERIIIKVTATIGLESNFIIKSANVTNALATTENGQRYILYNTTFLEKFKSDARTQWAAYSVLAHEIGHHLNNHDFGETDSKKRRLMELAADRFSGNILQKMGATLEEAQAGINTFSLAGETTTHPAKSGRLEAVANGWKQAKEGVPVEMEEVDNEKLAMEWFNKGVNAINAKEYQKAIDYNTEAIRLKPDYAAAFNNRGFAKRNLGKYTEAIADFDQAIRLKPDDADAFNNRGNAKRELGKYTEAIADFDQAIRLKPDLPRPYANKGCALVKLGRYGEAVDNIRQAENLDANVKTASWVQACKKEALEKLKE